MYLCMRCTPHFFEDCGQPILVQYINELYQLKVDVGMLNTVKNDCADVSSVGPSSEQKKSVHVK